MKLSFTNKTHVYSLLVTFNVLRLYVVTKKSKFFCVIFCIPIHSDPNILQISFLQPFSLKTWSANVIKLSSSSKEFGPSCFTETSFYSKKHLYREISISIHLLLYSHFLYLILTCCICANKIYISNMFINCNISYAIILPYCDICLEMLLKHSKNWKNIPYSPGLHEIFVT